MVETINLKIKVCLLGDGAVGKTSLIRRFVDNMFNEDYLLTIGTRTSKKKVIIKKPEIQKEFHITFIIWDIMGQISFRKLLHPTYLKGAKGALLVCDLTRKETLEHLDDWIDSLYVEGHVMPSIFVANKNDREAEHTFGADEVERVASAYDSPHFMTSAKTGVNVEETFMTLGERIIDYWSLKEPTVTSGPKSKQTDTILA
jgi:small GTP-binding protein